MKFISLVILATAMTAAHAQQAPGRNQLETRARNLALQMRTLIENNVDRIDNNDLNQVIRKLEQTKEILLGRGGSGPGPVPTPVPRLTCAQADAGTYQATFSKIKSFAYSSGGLNLDQQGSTNYALSWTQKYSCQDADQFKALFSRLRAFAYSSGGLNLDTNGAINYASNGIDRVCEQYNFEQDFTSQYNFAYSSSGLNMSSSGARNYAAQRVEPQMFNCSPFGF